MRMTFTYNHHHRTASIRHQIESQIIHMVTSDLGFNSATGTLYVVAINGGLDARHAGDVELMYGRVGRSMPVVLRDLFVTLGRH